MTENYVQESWVSNLREALLPKIREIRRYLGVESENQTQRNDVGSNHKNGKLGSFPSHEHLPPLHSSDISVPPIHQTFQRLTELVTSPAGDR
jgi:hypothetical protein